MTSKEDLFKTYQKLDPPVELSIGDDSTIQAVAKGTIQCLAYNGNEWIQLTLDDVYHVPRLGKRNVFSVGGATDRGNTVKLTARTIEFFDKEGKRILVGKRSPRKLWTLQLKGIVQVKRYSERTDMLVWHKRLGHTFRTKLQRIRREDAATGLKVTGDSREIECTDSATGRLVRLACKEATIEKGKPGQHLSVDLCGPMQTESLGGAKYFLVVKDRVTCYRKAYFLKTKEAEKVVQLIENHIRMISKKTGNKVKTLRTDNAMEFVNQEMTAKLSRMRIKHEGTASCTPEENKSIEREKETIIEMARKMIHATSFPPSLWAEMVLTAVYLHNIIPNRKDKLSPFERIFKKKPRMDHLRIIGSKVFVLIPKGQRTQLNKLYWTGRLVGYGGSTRVYRIYDPKTQNVHTCKEIRVLETKQNLFPRTSGVQQSLQLSKKTRGRRRRRNHSKNGKLKTKSIS
jgi:hypothetical protein